MLQPDGGGPADKLRPQSYDEQFRHLVETVKDYAIFLVDADGRVASWNAGAENIKGWQAREIIGQPIERFYTDEDRRAGKPARLLREATEAGRVEDEGWRVRKDGTRFWADVVITALRDPGGALRGFAKVTRDLTARKAAEEALRESEEQLRLLIQSVKDYLLFMVSPEGRVVVWNSGAESVTGYAAAEVAGKHVALFYLPEDRAKGHPESDLEEARRSGRFETEACRVRKDGSRFWASVVITPVLSSSGELRGFAQVVRDLTERRDAEEERVRLAQAQEAIRLRDEFLSIASHELKTPLTALQLQLQSLRKRVEALDEALAGRVDRASQSGMRLAHLVETLLDASRIASGRFELSRERFELGEAVRQAAEHLRETAARAGCELVVTTDAGLIGWWDRLRIEQVVTNLLANAFKYAAGSRVEVSVVSSEGEAVLSVQDHGPGIAAADVERIFGRFERAVSMRHYGGMGLGLYVTRQIVEAHGGAVEAANPPEGGARFTVRLPLAAPLGASSGNSARQGMN